MRRLATFIMEDSRTVGSVITATFTLKSLERIGDHATNVAEMVYFAATGTHLGDRPKGMDVTLMYNDSSSFRPSWVIRNRTSPWSRTLPLWAMRPPC